MGHAVDRFDLSGTGNAGNDAHAVELWLDESGINFRRGGRAHHVARFAELLHWAVDRRGLWVATRERCRLIRFRTEPAAATLNALSIAIAARAEAEPGGAEQRERIAAVDARARNPRPRLASLSIALACLAVYFLQAGDPFLERFASFAPALVEQGEWWRFATAHLVHGIFPIPIGGRLALYFPLHLISNLVLLAVFAQLVERPLGPLRTWVIASVGAIAAMLGSYAAGHEEVIGASGIVSALAGATLLLEFEYPQHLPAWWRLPRRFFIGVLLLQLASEVVMNGAANWAADSWGAWLPRVASAAHIGGFAGGWLAARVVAGSAFDAAQRAPLLIPGAALGAIGFVWSLAALYPLLERDTGALNRHGVHLLIAEDESAGRLNDLAWIIATESEPQPLELDVALLLAERAVELTERSNPDLLDTLAEVLFGAGAEGAAVVVIEEAIAIDPLEAYFQQQRERFLGNRPRDVRPRSPTLPWILRRPRWGEGVLLVPGPEIET